MLRKTVPLSLQNYANIVRRSICMQNTMRTVPMRHQWISFATPVEPEAFLDTEAFWDETRGIRHFGAVCHGGP